MDGTALVEGYGIASMPVVWAEVDGALTNPSRVRNAIAHWHAKTPLRRRAASAIDPRASTRRR
ncbi:hypothetical protein IF650_14730 [Cellulosimicrobium terreum]|nr:hypothetical protein [Cellulosimicrobium terreum]